MRRALIGWLLAAAALAAMAGARMTETKQRYGRHSAAARRAAAAEHRASPSDSIREHTAPAAGAGTAATTGDSF